MIETGRFLNVSTCNVRKETCEWLSNYEQTSGSGLVVYLKREYGYFVYWDHDEPLTGIPADLLQVIDLADFLECELICIDRDAPVVKHLPKYDW